MKSFQVSFNFDVRLHSVCARSCRICWSCEIERGIEDVLNSTEFDENMRESVEKS